MKLAHALTGLSAAALAFAPLSASAEPFEVDPAHTFVIFKVNHLGIGTAYGMFRETKGMFDPEAGKLDVTIDAGSLYTANKKRDDHLKGSDFFNVKQYPTIEFSATGVKAKGDDQYEVEGKLTMKGKTKPVTMMVTKVGEGKGPMGNYREGFEGKVTVNRLDFGVDYMPEALSKEVELTFAVEGVKKKK